VQIALTVIPLGATSFGKSECETEHARLGRSVRGSTAPPPLKAAMDEIR